MTIGRHENITYAEFEHNLADLNEPVIVGVSLTASWPCTSEWRLANGPNLAALRRYGHHSVQVANCSVRQFNEFERSERKLDEILDIWEREEGQNGRLYVKDWHQALLLEQDGGRQDQIYTTPDIFKDDWMTHHALSLAPPDDYRFTYAGPPGTFTPVHRDVYGSYSWSSNIVGRKRWWLIPPEHTQLFRTRSSKDDLVFDVREVDEALWEDKVLVVEQHAGETIFVPSGWHHQVENMDFCISINQNFASSHIMPTIYHNLLHSLSRVEDAISDVKELLQEQALKNAEPSDAENTEETLSWEKEWFEQVQSLLEMDAGWGLRGFWSMVAYNLRNPPTNASLRPSDEYVFTNIRPLVEDFKQRREYVVLADLARIVDEVASIVGTRP
ncbi:hypothetical protein QFC21_000343 [Naganishia friedmannii]|uniref:Uncharacterized protein n=1 Tax=Naganishia friedmannii TaxID=89922 RepID=A0ACC2WD76_9TREE|nr:hypothetical protein QFC21_000343 [Naganishia friedmannii]